jgi:hypothetical protein
MGWDGWGCFLCYVKWSALALISYVLEGWVEGVNWGCRGGWSETAGRSSCSGRSLRDARWVLGICGHYVIFLDQFQKAVLTCSGSLTPAPLDCYIDMFKFYEYVSKSFRTEVKVKLSLCFSKHHAMEAYWGSGCIAPHPGLFTPRDKAPGTHWIGGWVGPRAVLDARVKRKIPSAIPTELSRLFPEWVDNEMYAYIWYYSLRSNTKGYGGETH